MTFSDPLRDRRRPADTCPAVHQNAFATAIVMNPAHELVDCASLEITHQDIAVVTRLADVVKLQPQNIQSTGLERRVGKIDVRDTDHRPIPPTRPLAGTVLRSKNHVFDWHNSPVLVNNL
jgi:hypothetical protein